MHGIAQSIGGIAGTAHGITNAVLLPYVMKENYIGNSEKYDRIRSLLGMDAETLCEKLQIPKKTRELGVKEEMLQSVLEETMAYRQLANNPVAVTEELARKLIWGSY